MTKSARQLTKLKKPIKNKKPRKLNLKLTLTRTPSQMKKRLNRICSG